MARIVWTEGARDEFAEIRSYIRERNPAAAGRVGRRIKSLIGHLRKHPEMGKVGLIDGTRELVITDTPYVVIYIIDGENVVLLGVVHGAVGR